MVVIITISFSRHDYFAFYQSVHSSVLSPGVSDTFLLEAQPDSDSEPVLVKAGGILIFCTSLLLVSRV